MSCNLPATEKGLQRLVTNVMVFAVIDAILVNSKLPAEPKATICPKLAVLVWLMVAPFIWIKSTRSPTEKPAALLTVTLLGVMFVTAV